MNARTAPAAWYATSVADFVAEVEQQILGKLTARSPFAVEPTQRDAWLGEITILKREFVGLDGWIFLEFDVPRIGSRIDAVLTLGPAVFVIEFKYGEGQINTQDFNQAWDYALDLKNFHRASHAAPIVPLLVPTELATRSLAPFQAASDLVYRPTVCAQDLVRQAIDSAMTEMSGPAIDPLDWGNSTYQPTPTIIEAAQALYANHSVVNITRHDAGHENLAVTSQRVEQIIESGRAEGRKSIVFVTGVPGAGKTLVGLDVATKKRGETPTHAVFLSGNGPLVKVLREALARDEMQRLRARKDRTRKGVVQQKIKAFIQNVHNFRDEGLNNPGPPTDRVVIFDEAQRAWNREMTADFMGRKKGRPGFTQSEPEFLLSYLDRHADWAVVICLVGGGQEINRGEAGISAWLEAVSKKFPGWSAYISPNLLDSEYDAGHALQTLGTKAEVITDAALHLAVSMRSFRSEHVSRFVKAVLDREVTEARALLAELRARYPIVLTRNLERAKAWVRTKARGSERYGLVASSGAQRLKAHAVDVRVEVDPVHWFLNDADDTRSSYYLEDAATEFQVQGLELDWVCMAWDADFRMVSDEWSYHSFVATRWHNMRKADRRNYLRNAYRVLLTRARQGMVVFVPEGNCADATTAPDFYNGTFEYLKNLGIQQL